MQLLVGSRQQEYSAVANVPGVITFNKPYFGKNDWSPRIGFAYSPGTSGKWSIRGGASRAYDLTYINLNQNSSPAYYQTTRDVDPNNPTANFLAHGGLTAALPSGTVSVADAREAVAAYTWSGNRPYALTGTLGVQRLIGKDYTFEARYVYTKGVHLVESDAVEYSLQGDSEPLHPHLHDDAFGWDAGGVDDHTCEDPSN